MRTIKSEVYRVFFSNLIISAIISFLAWFYNDFIAIVYVYGFIIGSNSVLFFMINLVQVRKFISVPYHVYKAVVNSIYGKNGNIRKDGSARA